jgi:hypothetical protein
MWKIPRGWQGLLHVPGKPFEQCYAQNLNLRLILIAFDWEAPTMAIENKGCMVGNMVPTKSSYNPYAMGVHNQGLCYLYKYTYPP